MIRQSFIPDGTVIPIKQDKRGHTDVICTIIGALFALTLFIIACVFYNSAAISNAYFNFSGAAATASSPDYYGFQSAFWATVVTSLGLAIIWLAIVHLIPRVSPQIAHILAALTLIALGVVVLVVSSNYFNNNNGWKLAVAIFSFVLALIIICMFWFYINELRLQGIYLDYARRFLHQSTGTFGYILLFLFFTAGFLALIVFQQLAFSSKSNKNSNYWDFSNPGFLGILNIIEFIWGFQFLRDAFNFCVSGRATDWYWSNEQARWHTPFWRLLCRHWGSVVGGSFLNGFFQIPTLIVELFTCHRVACCTRAGNCCETRCCWEYFFGLVRTDSYSYITLSGLPFCNSGRECYNLCLKGEQFVGGFNLMKHYRFVATVFLTALGYLLGQIYANKRVVGLTWWHNVILVLIAYIVVCWFVNIDADAAEGISTSILAEYRLHNNYDNLVHAQNPFRSDLKERSNAHHDTATKDGHC